MRNGRIYGRGASDEFVSVIQTVIKSIVEQRHILSYNLLLAATTDEENGSAFGFILLLPPDLVLPDARIAAMNISR
ncbi:MAG: hypothetical protein ABH914_03615 [Candidatus Omnitrophota bacterium]